MKRTEDFCDNLLDIFMRLDANIASEFRSFLSQIPDSKSIFLWIKKHAEGKILDDEFENLLTDFFFSIR